MIAQPPKHPERAAFTLTELLVIIAVIALLATLRLSALAPAEEKAHRLGCLNNLKQLALGSQMYADDYFGHYSQRLVWGGIHTYGVHRSLRLG